MVVWLFGSFWLLKILKVTIMVINQAQVIFDELKTKIDITGDEEKAYFEAFSTRGKYKGFLKKQKPKGLAGVIWSAIQVNPWKVSIYSVVMMNEKESETYKKFSAFKYPRTIDYDRYTLEKLGVW